MDKLYCIIQLETKKQISLYFFFDFRYSQDQIYDYPICFTANSSRLLYILLLYHSFNYLLSFEHSLYLGKEIYKAYIALSIGQSYIQE